MTLDHLSGDLILDFLDHLQSKRGNQTSTRNQRLAAIKSLAKMIRFMYPDKRRLADKILAIPQKRSQRKLIGLLYPDEILKVYQAVDLSELDGFRDYTILHLLYDSGARASEVATLNLDYYDPQHQTMAILGKGDRFRQLQLWPKPLSGSKHTLSITAENPIACIDNGYLSINAAMALPVMELIGSAKSTFSVL